MGLFDLFRGSRKTTTISPSDIVVFIVGPSGSGKSRFMSILLQRANVHVRVSKGQKPGTTEVHAERCRFDGMPNEIVIVDTPSFCTYMEPDGEEVVRKWMESNYAKPCKAAKMLYMHNLAFNPDDTNLRVANHLRVFRRTCRQNLLPSAIHIIPTLSHGSTLSDERLKILATQLQRQADAEGALLCNTSDGKSFVGKPFDGKPFDGKPEAAWNILQELLNA
ncbi:hypothetical protein EDD16DRAFT_632289 [Pisolithus croceorrhizus]|nr:hypothetical protein F5141DRAFT_714938 [Pisolithus sp. B1]KAI6117111.1 hypothetical protein EV401DRAFT_1617872 [Pisolithus croceorrhizus]KAI6123657.1 hypothetical protein EDD16DRAFT_632289 [Pisolithus croceorrhizus]